MPRFRKDPDPRFWRLNRSVEFDWRLAPYDVDQSRAHIRALREIGVLDDDELKALDGGLETIGEELERGEFGFQDADEDIHMAIERRLGELVGDVAGKLHTGRSRNDQVATDVAMAVQAHALRAVELLRAAMGRLLSWRSATAIGRCPDTRICSAPSPSTSGTIRWPISGCSAA